MSETAGKAAGGVPTPAIEVDEARVAYGTAEALRGVSLAVPRAGFVALLGPNGSGKSTLLRAITRRVPLRAGTVRVEGQDVQTLSPRSLAQVVAVVPQSEPPNFDYTVWELAAMGRAPHQGRFGLESPQDRQIVEAVLKRVGALPLAARKAATLSGGELQRVILARALVQQPRILLLDEPTAHLDLRYQVELLALIRGLNRTDGVTVLAVLHDLNLAAAFADQLVLLKEGRVVAAGPPSVVLTAETLCHVFDTQVLVTSHPVDGTPVVLPLVSG